MICTHIRSMQWSREIRQRLFPYVGIKDEKGNDFWGVGIETDIIDSSLKALFSAVNNMINV